MCDYAGVIYGNGNGCECMSLNVCKYVMLRMPAETVAHVDMFKQTVAYVYVGLHCMSVQWMYTYVTCDT